MSYGLLIAFKVLLTLDSLPRKLRSRLLVQFQKICLAPANCADFQDRDDNGRLCDVCVYAEYAITYWIDITDRQVKILILEPADQRAS